MSGLTQISTQRCKNLNCKSMMTYGEDFASDPDFQAGMTDFWCLQTSRNYGPDQDEVSLEECSRADRTCYREF